MSSTALTFTSSATSARSASRSARSPPGRASHSRASGWRSLRPAGLRSVRASSTARRAVAIASSSGWSRRRPARRPATAVRWTLSGAPGSHRRRGWRRSPRTRNGRIGAATRTRARRAAWSVANAASRSAGSSDRENRRRDRRRYQVERSSMTPVDRPGRTVRVVVAEPLLGPRRETGHPRQDPAVERRDGRPAAAPRRRRRPAGEPGVGDEERVDVPQDEEPAAGLVGGVPAEQDVVVGPGPRVHPAHDVDAHPLGGLVELDRVAPALVHRPAVLAEERGVAEDRPERRLAAEHRAHREHRVEPVPELAREALGDEVGREPARPVVRVLAVVDRRERDDPGVEPGVADVADPAAPARRSPDRRSGPRPRTGGAACGPRSASQPSTARSRSSSRPPMTSTVPQAAAVVDRQGQAPVALLADHPVVHVQEPVELPLVAEPGIQRIPSTTSMIW